MNSYLTPQTSHSDANCSNVAEIVDLIGVSYEDYDDDMMMITDNDIVYARIKQDCLI